MKKLKKIITLLFMLSCLLGIVSPVVTAYAEELTANNEAAVPGKPTATNVVNGVRVKWTAVDGVTKYGVWRSETGVNGTYKWLGNPTNTSYLDSNVKSGKTYHYKITCMDIDSNTHSDRSASGGVTYVATPDITQRFNKAAGVTLTWDKITGATGYAIYRKSFEGGEDWKRIATVEGNSTFTWQDTSVKNENGMVYRYTIRALAGNNMKTLSGCRSTGRTMVRLTSRTLSDVTVIGDSSIKCTWGTTSQATGYEVRFMVDSDVYKTVTIGNYRTGTKTFKELDPDTTYKIQVRSYKKIDDVGSFYSAWSEPEYVTTPIELPDNYLENKEIWDVILSDDSRWGMWDLTYLEFIKMYRSIGTENDLFIQMLQEKGPRHTDPTIWYEFDGVANLEISFPDVLTEKIYALHYAPFEYNSADLESGNFGKDNEEAYLDHGGVCGILTRTYHHFIKEILGEKDWTFCEYGSDEANHAALLVKTEDGRIFQADNCGVDYWWLGLEFTPDYSKYECEWENEEAIVALENWKEEFATLEKVYWHTFSLYYDYDWEAESWLRRPVWYDYDTEEFITYLDEEMPKYYKVTFRGLPGKVISMAGNTKLEGYVDLSELEFE